MQTPANGAGRVSQIAFAIVRKRATGRAVASDYGATGVAPSRTTKVPWPPIDTTITIRQTLSISIRDDDYINLHLESALAKPLR